MKRDPIEWAVLISTIQRQMMTEPNAKTETVQKEIKMFNVYYDGKCS